MMDEEQRRSGASLCQRHERSVRPRRTNDCHSGSTASRSSEPRTAARRERPAQRLFDGHRNLYRGERMAAERKKIIADSNRAGLQYLLPQAEQASFELGAAVRRNCSAPRRHALPATSADRAFRSGSGAAPRSIRSDSESVPRECDPERTSAGRRWRPGQSRAARHRRSTACLKASHRTPPLPRAHRDDPESRPQCRRARHARHES